MNAWLPEYVMAGVVIASVAGLVIRDKFRRKKFIQKYAELANHHPLLPDEVFCQHLGIDLSHAAFVRVIREKLAIRLNLNFNALYPDGNLWLGFESDAIEAFEEPVALYFYKNYDYISDDVRTVGDLTKFLIQVQLEAKMKNAS